MLLTGLVTLACSAIVKADSTTWFINPTIGYQWFESDRQLDDDSLWGLGLEYHYDQTWGTELKYLNSSPDGDNNNANADLEQLMIEGLYKFGNHGNFQSHVAVGLGHADFDYDAGGTNKDTQVTAGAGARYWFDERWSAKADVRMVHNIDGGDNDQLLTLSISYAFNKAKPPKLMTSELITVPAPIQEPPKDSDGDGVPDNKDECLNTPSGAIVDDNGCAKKLAYSKNIILNVKFASDDYRIANNYVSEMGKVVEFMKQYPTANGVIEGHTDSIGSAEYNQQLSQRRAEAVRQVLVELFEIDPERLDAIGYGEEKPIADNGTAAGRQQNRRVVANFTAEIAE